MWKILRAAALLSLVSTTLLAQTWPEEVNRAIDRGVRRLLMMQREDGAYPVTAPDYASHNDTYPMGVTSLALYALLNSGIAPDDPAVIRALDYLKYLPLEKTYSVAMMILAFESTEDPSLRPRIVEAGDWLEKNVDRAKRIWGYPEPHADLSNTQLAVLALAVAEKRGFEAKRRTWMDLVDATLDLQNPDGGFGYRWDNLAYSSGTMTTAGITILHFAAERLERGEMANRARQGMERAWSYLERVFTTTGNPAYESGVIRDQYPGKHTYHYYHYYYLYGLERIAALARRTRVADRDWYKEGALYLLQHERPEGGWNGLCNTSLALLFLRRVTFSGLEGSQASASFPPAETWRYTNDAPPAGWTAVDFDDGGWRRGAGGFGNRGNPNGLVRTTWAGAGPLRLRRGFHRARGSRTGETLFIQHDDDVRVWVNGVLAIERSGWSKYHVQFDVSVEARAALVDGRNVIAVEVSNVGGACLLDLRLEDHPAFHPPTEAEVLADRARWWRAAAPEGGFVARWLVVGPLEADEGRAFHTPLIAEETVTPKLGDRVKGRPWTIASTSGGMLDPGAATRRRDQGIWYAFTWLDVKEKTAAVLWVGADDGVKIFLDDRVVLSHFGRQSVVPGDLRVPVSLEPGKHRLLVKLENDGGPVGLCLQVTDERGERIPHVRACLDPDHPDWSAIAAADPTALTWAELLEHLPTDTRGKLDFGAERDLPRVAVGPTKSGFPAWRSRYDAKDGGSRPSPGGRGILAIRPPSRSTPTRVIRKLRIPRGRAQLEARVSADAGLDAGASGCRIRLGVFDGELHWIETAVVRSAATPTRDDWVSVVADLEPWATREVLVILECAASEPLRAEGAFLDELSVGLR